MHFALSSPKHARRNESNLTMTRFDKDRLLSVSRMYESAQRLYSAVPYKFFSNGYAFPAWHYYFEVTRRCNLRCKMCQYIEWLENEPIRVQREGELSTQEWLDVIGQVRPISLITFTGGEPFVRKDFMDILSYASSRARTHVISNTTMLKEERAEELVALAPNRLGGKGLNFLGTSIEGPGELHDEIRRFSQAYERSSSGVLAVRQTRDAQGKQCPLIHVTTVIQQDNVHALSQMPQVMKDLGVDVVNFVTESRMQELPGLGLVDPTTYKTEQLEYPRVDRQQLTDALNESVVNARNVGIELRLPRMPREGLLDYYSGHLDLDHYECRNAWNTMFVGRQGDTYSCWIKKLGNVREDSLKTLWNNSTMRDFRNTCKKQLFAPCPGCCFLEHKGGRNDQGVVEDKGNGAG
jgi:radical SAM protein with 4Fe4S-binding SPASM domain